jgi:hypothetical protein
MLSRKNVIFGSERVRIKYGFWTKILTDPNLYVCQEVGAEKTTFYRTARQAFNINFGDSSTEFTVGGFPYTGEVKVTGHDGKGRPGEKLSICVRLFRDVEVVRRVFQQDPGIWSMTEGTGSMPA